MGRRRKPQPYAPLDDDQPENDGPPIVADEDEPKTVYQTETIRTKGGVGVSIQVNLDPTWNEDEARHIGRLIKAMLDEI